jgi:hypothetical protein
MRFLRNLFDFRRAYGAVDDRWDGMLWHRWAYWLNHCGWFYADIRHPVSLLRWWWRFAIVIPRSRGL